MRVACMRLVVGEAVLRAWQRTLPTAGELDAHGFVYEFGEVERVLFA